MAENKPVVGFAGLGSMGLGMATQLVKQGFRVQGFDIVPESVQRFKEAGGIPADSLKASAAGASLYLCIVATAAQVQTVLLEERDSIASALPSGATFLLCSTVPSTYAKSLCEQMGKVRPDVFFVDCPVSGGATRAAQGTLSMMAGASDAAISRARPVLEALSDTSKLFIVQGGVGQGSNMKATHQVLAAVHILATSEAFGFAARLGLRADEVAQAVIESDAWAWMFEDRAGRAIHQEYQPAVSALTIILKDAGIVTDMARQIGIPSFLCSCAEQMYLCGLAQNYGADDDMGMVRLYFPKPLGSVVDELSPQEKHSRTRLVKLMLESILLSATCEAAAFAKAVKIPLDQFYELASNAAGASKVFRRRFQEIAQTSNALPDADLTRATAVLSEAAAMAQAVKCPLPLATTSLNVLLALRGGSSGPWQVAEAPKPVGKAG